MGKYVHSPFLDVNISSKLRSIRMSQLSNEEEFDDDHMDATQEGAGRVFWMARRPEEMRRLKVITPLQNAVRALELVMDQGWGHPAAEMKRDVAIERKSWDPAMKKIVVRNENIDVIADALRKLESARQLLEELASKRDNAPVHDGAVRYGLVREGGRDVGAGRIANRWLECALDACFIRLADKTGTVQNHELSAILNPEIENFKVVHESLCQRNAIDSVKLDEKIDQFLDLFISGNLNNLAISLRKDAMDYMGKFRYHFYTFELNRLIDNEDRDQRNAFSADLRRSFLDKLKTLKNRCGEESSKKASKEARSGSKIKR